ncbi:MAG: M28 family peptidase [bacterium]
MIDPMGGAPAGERPPAQPASGGRGRLARVEELAFPRMAGTDGERRAADHVAARLAALGLDVSREPFRVSRTALGRMRRLLHGLVAAAIVFFAALARRGAAEAWIVGVATLALMLGVSSWRRSIERAFDIGPEIGSENVAGRRSPKRSGGATCRVVVLAHLDSKSTRFPTFWPASAVLATLAWLAFATALAALGALHPGYIFPRAAAAIGWALAALLFVVAWNPAGNESPGAMDNASGLAVLLELAESLPREAALDGVELTFLATGAEEVGLAGAMRWIQAHERRFERSRTTFLNVDSVGVGKGLLAIDVRGRAPDGRPMRRMLAEAAQAAGVRLRVLPFLPGVGVDTMPMGARGFATASILGEVLGAASRRIHSARDTMEPLEEEGLEAAVRLCAQVVREVSRVTRGDAGGGQGSGGASGSTLGGSSKSGE